MSAQSTNHIFMIEPSVFFANPQTMETNVYQAEKTDLTPDDLLKMALKEFQDYRDALVRAGVMITTAFGKDNCPDMVFPNWMSLHSADAGDNGGGENKQGDQNVMFIYPMLNDNRRAEKSDDIIAMLKRGYPAVIDWSHYEGEGKFLESTASIVMDRVNKRGYSGLSGRTHKEMVDKWCDFMGYTAYTFDTHSHTDKPVYHTDYLMYIGTDMAAVCLECFENEDDKTRVRKALGETHDVLELTMEQLMQSCGNALEVIGKDGERMLTMSDAAIKALRNDQLAQIRKHYNTIITSPLYTLEKFGGGSARCMLMELF